MYKLFRKSKRSCSITIVSASFISLILMANAQFSEAFCFIPNMMKMGKFGQPNVGGPPNWMNQQQVNPMRSMFQNKWGNSMFGKRWFNGGMGTNFNQMTRPAVSQNYPRYPLNEQLNVAPMTIPSNFNPNVYPTTNQINWPPQQGQAYTGGNKQQNVYDNYYYQNAPNQNNQPSRPQQQQQQQSPSFMNQDYTTSQPYGTKGGASNMNLPDRNSANFGNRPVSVSSTTRRPRY